MCRNLVVVGRSGRQLYTIDDDKIHCETSKPKNHNVNVKIVKHAADNRLGMICDALMTTTTMMIVSLQVQIKARKQHDNLRNQLYAVSFGSDPYSPPDLAEIEFHGDRGYFSENSFLAILLLCGCMLSCTCPKGNWLWCFIGKSLPEGDKRVLFKEQGMMLYEVREKKFTSGSQELTMAVGVFRTGTDKVVIGASSATIISTLTLRSCLQLNKSCLQFRPERGTGMTNPCICI